MISNTTFINKTGNIKGLPSGKLISKILELIEKFLIEFSQEEINFNLELEKGLSCTLADRLTIEAQKTKIPVLFREYIENIKKSNSPEVDIGIIKTDIYTGKSIFSFEAKRLSSATGNRGQEYVEGKRGGIERFKRNEHGQGLDYCGMIGYVQENNFEYWYDRINSWIDKLINNKSNNPKWNSEDKLIKDYENPIIAKYNSKHLRSKDGYINLVHLWVSLKSNKNICII